MIDGKLDTASSKLDSLIDAQKIAAGIRSDIEKRQDQRAKKIAGWSSLSSGVIVAVAAEFVRWVFFHKTGFAP